MSIGLYDILIKYKNEKKKRRHINIFFRQKNPPSVFQYNFYYFTVLCKFQVVRLSQQCSVKFPLDAFVGLEHVIMYICS